MSLGKPLIIVLLSLAVAGYCAIHLVKGVRQDRAKPNSTEEGRADAFVQIRPRSSK
jgi:uncharacterized integral membrane protein